MKNQNSNKFFFLLLLTGTGWLVTLVILLTLVTGNSSTDESEVARAPQEASLDISVLEEQVVPAAGYQLPITWQNLGKKMVDAGVIEASRFESVYESRGGLNVSEQELLNGNNTDTITITKANSGVLLNLLWAFGLSNKNPILEEGPMMDPKYGGDASRFASTGGWTLAEGKPMNHYSAHPFVTLTSEQWQRVENVAKGIYRPCCGNSTHFPDCNHGMAMLGLLQLMAAEGLSEEEMYEAALAVNSYWFPETYLTLASYFKQKGVDWTEVAPQVVLAANYSSGAGYQRVLQQMKPVKTQGGGGCSV